MDKVLAPGNRNIPLRILKNPSNWVQLSTSIMGSGVKAWPKALNLDPFMRMAEDVNSRQLKLRLTQNSEAGMLVA
jgi:hypothetical protein